MACNDRQLSQAQREAAYQQQRTGVVQALRPFSGAPTLQNLLDYLNRELVPAVRATRNAANDIYLQVADNAPSANPLAYYFSTDTAASDPTTGRIKLNAATQNTSTIIRVSQSNARLQDVTPWLDVMSGGPTTPLGTVTLVDAVNPGRFLRFDLNTMTDQGTYWDLGVTFIEGSHDDPFVQDEGVVLGFISGVSAAGSTVPVGSLSPIARDTFVGNIGTTTAAPSAVPLADVDSTSIVYDPTSHTFQRAAVTGAIAISQNANTSRFSGILNNGVATIDRTNINVVSTTSIIGDAGDDAVNDEIEFNFQRAALTGAIAATQNSNATRFAGILDNGAAENDRTSLNFLTTTSIIAVVTDDSGNDELEITAQRAALTGAIAASQNSNTTVFSGIRNNGAATTDRGNINVVSTTSIIGDAGDDAANDEIEFNFQRAALTGAIVAAQNSNATTFGGILDNGAAENNRTNLNFLSGDSNTATITDDAGNDELEVTFNYVGSTTNVNLTGLTGSEGVIDISTLRCGGSVTVETVSADYSIDGFTAQTNGFWFWFIDRRQSGTTAGLLNEDSGATTTSIRNDEEEPTIVPRAGRVLLYYFNNRWRAVGFARQFPSDSMGAQVTRTNTTTAATLSIVTVPAGVSAVGHSYYVYAYLTWERGATATASQLSMQLLIDGNVAMSISPSVNTTVGSSGYAQLTAFINVVTVGGSGLLTASGDFNYLIGTVVGATHASNSVSVDTAGGPFDIEVDAQFTVAVSGLEFTTHNGVIRRMT